MLYITYTPNGDSYSDFYAENTVRGWGKNAQIDDIRKRVSTENVIHALRMLVAEGEIPPNMVMFRWSEDDVWHTINEYGVPDTFKGFPKIDTDFSYRILKARSAKHKAKEN